MSGYAVGISMSPWATPAVALRGRRTAPIRPRPGAYVGWAAAIVMLVLLGRLLGFGVAGVAGVPGLDPVQGTSAVFSGTSDNAGSTFTAGTWASATAGTLHWFGAGGKGQGGVYADRTPDQEVTASTAWSNVSSSGSFNCAVRSTGTLWCWGYKADGQLGIASMTQQTSPTQVGTEITWTGLSVGGNHTCATQTPGTLWCWGNNTFGQLGTGTDGSSLTSPTQAGTGTGTSWASRWRSLAHVRDPGRRDAVVLEPQRCRPGRQRDDECRGEKPGSGRNRYNVEFRCDWCLSLLRDANGRDSVVLGAERHRSTGGRHLHQPHHTGPSGRRDGLGGLHRQHGERHLLDRVTSGVGRSAAVPPLSG